MKLSPTQLRVLRLLDELTDEHELWPGHRFYRLPRSQCRKPTINALERQGLIWLAIKRMGGGISHAYWRVTENGRHCLSSMA